MPITVTVTRVREKAAITGTAYDARITTLIAELVPVIEYSVERRFVDDPNTQLVATLNLAATEVIAGEITAEIAREPGASESLSFGWFELSPAWRDLNDPFGLKRQGLARLTPYLKPGETIRGTLGVSFGGEREPEDP